MFLEKSNDSYRKQLDLCKTDSDRKEAFNRIIKESIAKRKHFKRAFNSD